MSCSPKPSIMIPRRTPRMRNTSTCASAMRSAAARRGSPAPSPAMRRASAATSPASAGSASTGRLNPWRRALRATAALPAGVRGPVLRAALARLAARTLSLAHVLVGEPASTPHRVLGRLSPEHARAAPVMPARGAAPRPPRRRTPG
jgi:hypothetical protein